jgi:hypothetical protein
MGQSLWAGLRKGTTCTVLLGVLGCTPEQFGLVPAGLSGPATATAGLPEESPPTGAPAGEEVVGSAGAGEGGPPGSETPDSPFAVTEAVSPGPAVWGVVGLRGYGYGQQLAPNGLEYNPLFSLDLTFNLWLWRPQGLYLFSDTSFWGQKASQGITNPSQGVFDFSKRELDFIPGVAWNYFGNLEARAFAYSFNNLNRGVSPLLPGGYNDGVGLENRYYLGPTYADLGTPAFDVARAAFVSLGYYPTKDMTGGDGHLFKPGPFARAYLTLDLYGEQVYLFLDTDLLGTRSWTPKVLQVDGGVAFRPFPRLSRLEFRLGSENHLDLRADDRETALYGEIRLIY